MRLFATILMLVFTGHGMLAQSPVLDQWFLNNYLTNPAITGIEQYMDVQLSSRLQWTGVDGAPSSHFLSVHTPLGNPRSKNGFTKTPTPNKPTEYNYKSRRYQPHHGLGGLVYMDRVGPFANLEANISYAYHIPVAEGLFLSAGASVGLFRQALDTDLVSIPVQGDPAISGFNPNSTLVLRPGLWLYGEQFYLGASLSEFFNPEDQDQLRTTIVTTGYRFDSSAEGVHFTPYALARINTIRNNYDLGMKVDWRRLVYIGATYRSTNEAVIYLGASINFRMSFTYLYNTGSERSFTSGAGGTHEFQLNFRVRNRERIPCPQRMW